MPQGSSPLAHLYTLNTLSNIRGFLQASLPPSCSTMVMRTCPKEMPALLTGTASNLLKTPLRPRKRCLSVMLLLRFPPHPRFRTQLRRHCAPLLLYLPSITTSPRSPPSGRKVSRAIYPSPRSPAPANARMAVPVCGPQRKSVYPPTPSFPPAPVQYASRARSLAASRCAKLWAT